MTEAATIRELLTKAFSAAFVARGVEARLGEVVPCGDPSLGDFQCNGAMPAAKSLRRNPREIAAEIATAIGTNPLVASCTVAGPGFINVRVSDAALIGDLARDGIVPAARKSRIVVDYGGPNLAKAMHVGHLRSSIIGESLKRILRARGHEVVGDVHLGDWGLPMGLLAAELKLAQPDLPFFDPEATPFVDQCPVGIDDLERMYPQASARSKVDPEFLEEARKMTAAIQAGQPGLLALWESFREVSVERLEADFGALGVTFDRWDGESTVDGLIPGICADLEAKGVAVVSDGALVVPVAREGDQKEMPPLILRKSDGSSLYSTTDLATLVDRANSGFDRIVYVVDARQALHFEQVFRAAAAAGVDGVQLEHAGFGTVNGADGKPFKTREGGVMKLADLIAMATDKAAERLSEGRMGDGSTADEKSDMARVIGLGAVKFSDLSAHRSTSYVFDLDRFVSFEGRTGPYVQYMAVRLAAVLAKAEAAGLLPGAVGEPSNDAERALMVTLSRFGDAVARAEQLSAPSEVAQWLFDTAQAVARFYGASPVLQEEDRELASRRLALAKVARERLLRGLDLLGIEVPTRM